MIINGASPEEATALAKGDPIFELTVRKLETADAAIEHYGSMDKLPEGTLTLIAMGQTILFGKASNYEGGAVVVPCAANGVCQVELAAYLQTLKTNPNSVEIAVANFRNEVIKGLANTSTDDVNGGPFRLDAAFRDLLNCVSDNPANAADDLLAAYRANPSGFQALAYRTYDVTRVNPQSVIAAVEGLAAGGNIAQFETDMTLAQLPRSTALDGLFTIAGIAYEFTPVADTVAMVEAADSGDVAGIMIASVGFLPIAKAGKLLGKSAEAVKDVLKAGGDEAGKLAKDIAQEAGRYAEVGGHHVHAKAAFKNHMNYNPKDGFSISQEFMNTYGLRHADMTSYQRQAFTELARTGKPNTLAEHTRIAVEALKAGGADETLARTLVARSLAALRASGVRVPTDIPWKK